MTSESLRLFSSRRCILFASVWSLLFSVACGGRTPQAASGTGSCVAPDALVTLTGALERRQGHNALQRPESYLALALPRAQCAAVASIEDPREQLAVFASTLQITNLDAETLRSLRERVGLDVSLRGRLVQGLSPHHHTPLMLELTEIVYAPEADTSLDPEGDESLVFLDGDFRIVEALDGGVSALDASEVDALMGRNASFLYGLELPWLQCADPSYRHRPATPEAFLSGFRTLPSIAEEHARRLGLDQPSLIAWQASCGEPAASLHFVSTVTGHVMIPHDGVIFVLSPR